MAHRTQEDTYIYWFIIKGYRWNRFIGHGMGKSPNHKSFCSNRIGVSEVKVKSLSRVQLFATPWAPWTVAYRLLCPWDFPSKNTGVGCHFLLQEIFPTHGLNPSLPHCWQTLYHLSHQKSHPLVGNSNPLQYSCLEKSTDREAWKTAV